MSDTVESPVEMLRRSQREPPGAKQRAEGPSLTVECVTTSEGLHRLGPDWRTLFAQVPDALPFASHEWAVAWWTHLRRDCAWLQDALRVYVVRTTEGELLAIAPLMVTTYRILGLPLVRVLQPIGADPNITEIRGMLVDCNRELEVVEALRLHLRQNATRLDWVCWNGVRREGTAIVTLLTAPYAALNREHSAFVLAMPDSWEEFRKSRPRNIRESLRKCYNSLARDGHKWNFRTLDSKADVLASLERFFDLHGRRAQADVSVAHPNYFASEAARRFLADVVEKFGERGIVRMFQLEIGGEIVAMRIGFRFGDALYLYYSGYDLAWGRYSVMTTVVAEALRYACESGVRLVNLSTGKDVSKTRWRPNEVCYGDVITLSSGLRARLAFRALGAANRWRPARRANERIDAADD